MSLSLVSAKSEGFKPVSAADLDRLQQEQFHHDECYHREIARLTVQRRLTHMALHFAKYAGYLADSCTVERQQKILVDILIIGLSSANVLNIRLSENLDLGMSDGLEKEPDFLKALTISVGRMSAACEKLDHLEDYPFRPVIQDSVLNVLNNALLELAARKLGAVALVHDRLQGVRANAFFTLTA